MARVALWLSLLLSLSTTASAAAVPEEVTAGIRQAGNAEDDGERLEILKRLQSAPGLDTQLQADLRHMVAAVDRWINHPLLPYFSGELIRKLDFDFGVAPESPLYALTHLYRGRMLVWLTLESGGLVNNVNRRREVLDKAVREFKLAAAAFPDNRVAGMYLGRPIPCRKQYPAVPGAPEWAALQRENLERLADVIGWWIDHRMRPNGEYGDCEMWRFWVPVLIAFDDPKITRAQARFSEALMSQSHMKAGYTRYLTDVEHSAEDSSDVITPMMHLDPDNSHWKARALRPVELMETLWTGRNQRGQLQFKSTYFCVDRVDSRPERACDTVYHPRAVQPALLLWQRTGDPRLGKLFTAWMDTWVDAAARAERGKPAGIIPSAIHWPDGRVGGTSPDWWDPRNHGEATLYAWPSALRMMNNTLLLTWYMTKDEKYLAPLRSMASVRLKWLKGDRKGQEAPPGSEAWCAQRLSLLAETLAKYKRATGSREFDDLLAREGHASLVLDPAANRPALTSALRDSAEALRVNFEGYTSEVRYTDRVLRFPSLFREGMMFAHAIPAIKMPDTPLMYATATGDPGDCGYMPLAAARWLTPPRDIAAMVMETGPQRFTAELFHFGPQPRSMGAELYLLSPGGYSCQLQQPDGKAIGPAQSFSVSGARTRIRFELPPRRLCVVRVVRD